MTLCMLEPIKIVLLMTIKTFPLPNDVLMSDRMAYFVSSLCRTDRKYFCEALKTYLLIKCKKVYFCFRLFSLQTSEWCVANSLCPICTECFRFTPYIHIWVCPQLWTIKDSDFILEMSIMTFRPGHGHLPRLVEPPARKFFTDMERSPLSLKGITIEAYARHSLRRKILYDTCCDKRPRFYGITKRTNPFSLEIYKGYWGRILDRSPKDVCWWHSCVKGEGDGNDIVYKLGLSTVNYSLRIVKGISVAEWFRVRHRSHTTRSHQQSLLVRILLAPSWMCEKVC
jgi:hypothetical protein